MEIWKLSPDRSSWVKEDLGPFPGDQPLIPLIFEKVRSTKSGNLMLPQFYIVFSPEEELTLVNLLAPALFPPEVNSWEMLDALLQPLHNLTTRRASAMPLQEDPSKTIGDKANTYRLSIAVY